MFPELQDYGIIFLCVALFGFIILDIYKTGRDLGIPNFYKSYIEQIFHYISVAILGDVPQTMTFINIRFNNLLHGWSKFKRSDMFES